MKKLLQLLLLISLVILPGFSGTAFASSNEIYSANSLIGGGAGALDKIDGALLDDGDMAIVITSTLTYRYYLNASSGAAESSPSIVSPDTNAGTKRWILKATDVGAGGTGLTTITDGGVLLGSGTSAVTPMAVLADGELIVGDGTTDPVAESGATLRTSIGVGTGDTPQFTGVEVGHATDTTVTRASAGDVNIEGNIAYRAGGTDVPVTDGGTGASTLTDHGVVLGSGAGAVSITDSGADGEVLTSNGASADPDWEYQPKQNLLTNSGFGVWSNSTLENVGSAVAEDDCADDDTGDWTVSAGSNLVFDTDHYELDTDDANEGAYLENVSYTEGKLYRISFKLKDGTATPTDVRLFAYDGATFFYSAEINTTGSFVTYTFTFEAGATTAAGHVGLRILTATAGSNIELKDFTLYEVTPGCVAADALGPDGWQKTTTMDIWREHDGANTKDGSFYSLKMTTATSGGAWWPDGDTGGLSDNKEFYKRFAGKTITVGVWAKTSTASAARIRVGDTYSSYHTGGGDWEWLEYTVNVATDITVFYLALYTSTASTIYWSQPMLVFGSSIGAGNYSSPAGEVVFPEAVITLTDYAGDTPSDGIINLEAQSDGQIPKGCKAVLARMGYTSSAAQESNMLGHAAGAGAATLMSYSLNAAYQMMSGWVKCDANGDIYIDVAANTGATYISIVGIEMR